MMDVLLLILPTVSTLLIVLSAVTVGVGWKRIKEKNIKAHLRAMRLAAVFAIGFFAIYASRTVFIGNTAFGGPDSLKNYYTLFLVFHIVLAGAGAVLGIVSLYSGAKKNLDRHKKLGPVTSVVWFFTAFTGVAVYLLLYVFFEGGETTSVVKAIIGG